MLDEKIDSDDIFTFVFTAKYSNLTTNINERVQATNIKFTINYLGEDDPDELFVVPDTGNNTMSTNANKSNLVLLIVSACGVIICAVLIIKKHKKATKIMGMVVAIISVLTVATTVKAVTTGTAGISINSTYNLHDKLLVTYMVKELFLAPLQ